MVDSILVQNGKAHEIWRGIAKSDLPPLHKDILANIVEAPDGTVNEKHLWDGTKFSAPPVPIPPPPKRNLEAELDAEKARASRLEAALLAKGTITDRDIAER